MKKALSIIFSIILLATMTIGSYAKTMVIGDVNGDGRVTAQDARLILRIAAGLEPSLGTVEIQDGEQSTEQDIYTIGSTWRVSGQWELTITSVEKTDDRNQFSDKNPEAVYLVNYTYKNIGYVDDDGIMDGLYMSIDDTIVDSAGKMGYSYPGDVSFYPKEVPVGAYCEAQACIGVDHAGNFKLYVSKYDGHGNEHKATFLIEVK